MRCAKSFLCWLIPCWRAAAWSAARSKPTSAGARGEARQTRADQRQPFSHETLGNPPQRQRAGIGKYPPDKCGIPITTVAIRRAPDQGNLCTARCLLARNSNTVFPERLFRMAIRGSSYWAISSFTLTKAALRSKRIIPLVVYETSLNSNLSQSQQPPGKRNLSVRLDIRL
jgi:hypothetical protein